MLPRRGATKTSPALAPSIEHMDSRVGVFSMGSTSSKTTGPPPCPAGGAPRARGALES